MEMVATLSGGGVAHCSACPPSTSCNPISRFARAPNKRPVFSSSVQIAQTSSNCATLQLSSLSCRSSFLGSTPEHFMWSFGGLPFRQLQPRLLTQEGPLEERERCGIARSYMESNNAILKFFKRVQGALPVVGLLSRLSSGVGGVGTDRVRFEEFCTRVGRNCTREDTRAFYAISARHGKSAKPQFMLIWCWAAAVGAGLLRSEDLLLGASRLRVSFDLQFEVENFDLLMDEATQRREKSGSKAPEVPMEFRVEKALEAMCKCCTGSTSVLEEDAPLYVTILKAVFPTVDKEQIEDTVAFRLFDPSSAVGAAPASEDAQSTSEILSSSSQKEIDEVVASQILDPLNDDELDEDDNQDADVEDAQSSVPNSPQNVAQELVQ